MRVGVLMVFQRWGYDDGVDDAQVYDEEIRLGELADELGYDALWAVEHHFDDYSFCPDNVVLLAHMAARTRRIKLATGAVILPWNQPLRVAERVALLDQLAPGRVLFGMGRGLARSEYAGFLIPMDESRDRFDEAAPMILRALEIGWIEGAGPYFPQPRTPIRPKPRSSFTDRIYCVAMSPDSVLEAADLGARMVIFSQRPWPDQAATIATYGERFVARHGRDHLCEMYLGVQAWGTPDQVVEKLLARREHIGDYDLTCAFRYAGLPYELAARSMRLFATEVLPRLPTATAARPA